MLIQKTLIFLDDLKKKLQKKPNVYSYFRYIFSMNEILNSKKKQFRGNTCESLGAVQ